MNIIVNKEQFDEIKNCLNNSLISTEQWTHEKGSLLIKCEDDMIVADVMECDNVGQGRWLLIFVPVLPGVTVKQYEKPISHSLEEIPVTPTPKRPMKEFLESITKPWHGYYVDKK